MNITVPIALFGWPLVVILLCATRSPRRAVIAAFLTAWLFLPVAKYPIAGFPDWTKMSATSLSLFLGVVIFDLDRLLSFRFRWVDVPMGVWCLCPLGSSLSNGLGFYDGMTAILNQIVMWGLPYLIGRIYFSDLEGLRELAIGIFIGGLVYIPFCLYEIRMSPQLHRMVYGFHQHSFAQTHRFAGWRPTVFMEHGLMVGMWMSMAALAGAWLWMSGALRSLRGIPLPWFLIPLLATAVLCKSSGALVLLAVGLIVLWSVRSVPTRAVLVAAAAAAPLYMALRAGGFWSGEELVAGTSVLSTERAGSLQTRLHNEDMLSAKARRRPVFGWGGWGRSRVYDERGNDISVTDGRWIIELGTRGLVGLGAMLVVFLSPAATLIRSVPLREWSRPAAGPAAALAMVMVLYLIDCIPNAMVNPIYLLGGSGVLALTGWTPMTSQPRPQTAGQTR
ncbi:MAG: O-antigen ligase domain-containing protein [Planctomycetes bacterium]|nr:O-antigen ligase domain-containing protein [Planctomycetota bacterium]